MTFFLRRTLRAMPRSVRLGVGVGLGLREALGVPVGDDVVDRVGVGEAEGVSVMLLDGLGVWLGLELWVALGEVVAEAEGDGEALLEAEGEGVGVPLPVRAPVNDALVLAVAAHRPHAACPPSSRPVLTR